MLHVLVKSTTMGKRKAWYIGALHCEHGDMAIVVFKNNNPEHLFSTEPLGSVCLDMTWRPETSPVMENSLQKINSNLKRRKNP